MKTREVKKEDEVFAILNTIVRYKIGPSKIEGVGVIAITDIPKGTKLYTEMFPQGYKIPFTDFKKLHPKVRNLLLERWPNIVNDSMFMWPDVVNTQVYMNHSDDPNFDAKNDVTIKDIKEGEEITEDYRKIENSEKIFKWLK